MAAPGGRPTIYTEELAQKICDMLIDGMSLNSICLLEEMPERRTVYNWLMKNDEFFYNYTHARELQADTYFDQCADIADDGSNDFYMKSGRDGEEFEAVNHEHIQRSKLRVETRLKICEKMAPKKYGLKAQLEHTGKDNGPIEQKTTTTMEAGPGLRGVLSALAAAATSGTDDGGTGGDTP